MTKATYQGVVSNGTIVLRGDGPSLTDGTEVIVTPVANRGSPAAVIAAMDAAPSVPPEWVDELERLIAEGRRLSTRLHQFPFEHPKRR